MAMRHVQLLLLGSLLLAVTASPQALRGSAGAENDVPGAVEHAAEQAGDAVGHAAKEAGSAAGHAAEKAGSAVEHAGEAVGRAGEDATSKARKAAREGVKKAKEAADAAKKAAEEAGDAAQSAIEHAIHWAKLKQAPSSNIMMLAASADSADYSDEDQDILHDLRDLLSTHMNTTLRSYFSPRWFGPSR